MKGKSRISKATFINSRVTSTISIALVLFFIGLIVLLGLFANNLTVYVKENLSFDVILDNDMKDTEIKNLQKMLDIAPYVKSTKYISKEDAIAQLVEDLGQDPEELLGYNPLPAMIEVKLRSAYANNDSIVKIENKIKEISSIKDVEYRKELMQIVNENTKKIGLILLSLALLLLLISLALINNTIQLMVYSKRFLIHTMRLVGATNAFIIKPFVRSNIFSGIVAAIIAIVMLLGLLYYLSQNIVGFIGLINLDLLLIVFAIVILFGILISITATYFAVNKYLKMKGDDLYFV